MAIIEKAKIGGTRDDGSQILLPEVETVIKNAKTEVEYDDDDHAAADVADPNTDTTDADIQRTVTIRVLKGIGAEGGAG
jgi:hypothetical protein